MSILGEHYWESEGRPFSRQLLGDIGEVQGERMMIEKEMAAAASSPAPSSAELGFSLDLAYNNSSIFQEDYEENYLEKYLGPKHLPYSSLIPITVIYTAIFVTGIFGNLSTCLVIAKAHYMRSSTNYYLFNLAIADMLTLIFGKYNFTWLFFGFFSNTSFSRFYSTASIIFTSPASSASWNGTAYKNTFVRL